MGETTPPCGTSDLNCRFVDVWFLNVVYAMRPLMYLSMVCGMLVCVSLSINVCMLTVSNALLMSNATAMVRVDGMGWLKTVATVLLMLCSAVFGFVCSVLCKEESSSRVITGRRDIGLYDVTMLMSLLGLGIGMMLANFQT